MYLFNDIICKKCGSSNLRFELPHEYLIYTNNINCVDLFNIEISVKQFTQNIFEKIINSNDDFELKLKRNWLLTNELSETLCLSCSNKDKMDFIRRFNTNCYYEFERLEKQYILSELSLISNYNLIDIDRISSLFDWHVTYNLKPILNDYNDKYNKIFNRIQEAKNYFSPETGNPNDFFNLYELLSAIGVGVISNALWSFINKKINFKSYRKIAKKETKYQLEKFGYIGSITTKDSELIRLLSTMSKSKRKRILNEFALQHAKNIKNQIKKQKSA